MSRAPRMLVVGAGPAGLTAAHRLVAAGERPLVLERTSAVGGIARTEVYRGHRIDIGGHRFFTKVARVSELWDEILGPDLLEVDRLSRIYHGGRFYRYPLDLLDTLRTMGVIESVRIGTSFLSARLRARHRDADSFEQWVCDRFGERLYRTFFKEYTEKVWGLPCSEIRADWAAQRIRDLSLRRVVVDAIAGRSDVRSLVQRFLYPRLGPGMMWERCRDIVVARGGEVRTNAEVLALRHDGRRVRAAVVRDPAGLHELAVEQILNSMPLDRLVCRLDPSPPAAVLAAARGLRYRDFLIVALILDREHLFPDNWIYVHSPGVGVGRIQNFKNWSAAMVPDRTRTCLGMEYFCSRGDAVWRARDAELIDRAGRELESIGLGRAADVVDGTVLRQPLAYPVYDPGYRERVDVLRRYLATFDNLQTFGRGGMHRYNNQDHSMLTALLAVENLDGAGHDLWEANVERSYHEELAREDPPRAPRASAVLEAS